MYRLYNIAIWLAKALLPLTGIFSGKMKKFMKGRKETFHILSVKLGKRDKVIWFHMASLGEFEQGVPIIEVVKKRFPGHKILVSFFSPSGYENKKNTPLADVVVYLPLDTRANAKKFLKAAHPDLVIFIKYEFWPNYLRELKLRSITTLLVSGSFRRDQLFFKAYGRWMARSLQTFQHFFVQNTNSRELLNSLGYKNVTVSGDTRFDRVAGQLKQDNSLAFIEDFKDDNICIVAGSTWPEDEELLEDFINNLPAEVKFILAPHDIKSERIKKFRSRISKSTLLYSEKEAEEVAHYQVFIIDTIGLLNKIYSYADIAYVGGAAGTTGLHNILEPATFGIPVVIGNNFENFPEAKELQRLAGLYSVGTREELAEILSRFLSDKSFRLATGMIAGHFIHENTGATAIVEKYMKENC